MSLVVLENLGLSFGGRSLFSNLNYRIDEGERVGLIGRNGSGKSSLLRVIGGVQEAGEGSILRARAVHIGYLPQELPPVSGQRLLESVVASVPGRTVIETEIEEVQSALEATSIEAEQLELAQRLVDLHERLADFETEFGEHKARAILDGLGFPQSDMTRALGEFSGGWRMRAVLAGLLFSKPDLLMLDEPTNHLDLPSVTWLGEFLKRYKGSFLLICHDREFLNDQIDRVVSFEAEGVRQYRGNYDAYLRSRAEELEVLDRRAANLSRERDTAERFIRRFRAQASKARAVQSRVKALEKLDEVEIPQQAKSLSFRFPPCDRAGQDVVRLENTGHDYGLGEIFSGVTLTARRGDRIAIVGANGNGKTTLLRIIAGQIAPSAGNSTLGHNVKAAYYAQHVAAQLDVRATVFDDLWRHSAVEDVTLVRTALGTMLFSGDDVDKIIGVLSGGEKARVALARILVAPGNLILMDEPTNHLDLESSEALADALASFGGTIIFVSHNRSFVKHLANRIWDVRDGRVEEFPGTLSEYMAHLAARGTEVGAAESANRDGRGAAEPVAVPAAVASQPQADSKGRGRHKRSNGTAAQRALKREVEGLEQRIAELEERQVERSAELSKPDVYEDQDRYTGLLRDYREDAAKLEELLERWERSQQGSAD